MIAKISKKKLPLTPEEYGKYYKICDSLPFAFTDIEMVFNEEKKAVDWIFRYGNEALATLEKLPLDKMIGNSFSSLFSNMDAKWLHVYERATLYGETLEIMDYSPEIDTNLKIICFLPVQLRSRIKTVLWVLLSSTLWIHWNIRYFLKEQLLGWGFPLQMKSFLSRRERSLSQRLPEAAPHLQ